MEQVGTEVDRISIEEARTPKIKSNNDRTKYISVYLSNAHSIESAIKKSWHLLQNDEKFSKLFKERPLFEYKKGKSIGNHLVRSDLISKKNSQRELNKYTRKRGTHPCNNCQNCHSIIKGDKINHLRKGYPIKINNNFSCNSQNVVYILKCPCGMAYIGQTSKTIKIRINEHRSGIRTINERK